jgi:hypothetical protein
MRIRSINLVNGYICYAVTILTDVIHCMFLYS